MKRLILAPLLLTGLVAASCGSGGSSGAHTGAGAPARPADQLTVAVSADPDTLDPAQVATAASAQIVGMVVEPLLALDQRGQVEPLLAARWQAAPDASSFTFSLRPGVRFSDGEPLDAAAVKVSLDRLLGPRTVRAQARDLSVIRSVTVVDRTHVELTLRRPFPQLPAAMAGIQAGIVAPGSISTSPLTPPQLLRLVGTGPYVLSDRVAGRRLTMTRNPGYWGRRPSYRRQVYEVVREAAAREAMVRSGQADVAVALPASDLAALQSVPAVSVVASGSAGLAATSARVTGVYALPDDRLVTAWASRR